jgi:hypothetical protein
LARSRHASVRSLERYARRSVDAAAADPHGLDDQLGDLPLFPPHPYEERQGAFLEVAFMLAGHRLDVDWFETTVHRRYFVRT